MSRLSKTRAAPTVACMMFHVIEDNAIWWVRLGRGVLVGPFCDRDDAVTWGRSFAGDHRDLAAAARTERKSKSKRKRFRIVGGQAA